MIILADKDRERKPVKVVLDSVSDFAGFTDISEEKQERPDFVFRKDNHIIGLEHIEIPILPMNGQNIEKYFKNKSHKMYYDWKDIYSDHYEDVTKDLENLINAKLDVYSTFTHNDYLANCARLLGVGNQEKRKHNATKYKGFLKEKYPDCDIKISFVLDIGYDLNDISYFQYRAMPNEPFRTQRYLDFPFTIVFLVLLGQIKDVNDIYIVWHPHDDYDSKYVRCYDLHYEDNGFIKKESTIPRVFWEFDMPEKFKKGSVKLNFEKSED